MKTLLILAAVLLSPKMAEVTPAPIFNPPARPMEQWVVQYPKNVLGSGYVVGNGTITNPYSGDMTTILNGLPQEGVMHIGPGSYPVECDRRCILKAGQTIIGAGKYSTRLWRDERFSYNQNQPVLWGVGSGITVQDMCLDAMSTNGDSFAHGCLTIWGAHPRVQRVHGLAPSGSWTNANECWTFFMVTGESLPTGLVEDCTVSDVRGDYVEGFSASGACRFNRLWVTFPVLTPPGPAPFFNGYQASQGSILTDCGQTGGSGYFYTDTESSHNLRITGGVAQDVLAGIYAIVKTNETCESFTVESTSIEFATNVPPSVAGVAIWGDGTIRNVTIRNCSFRYSNSAHGPAANAGVLRAVAIDGATGTKVLGNSIDPDFRVVVEASAVTNNTLSARMPLPVEPVR